MRARENRQNAEDQRSIVGSIGYIAGNMGYMEGNLSAIDYSYGGAATHYPLWKPHFPRGEAPPPYEEAVAISQAEALSAQCVVSLPASSQRAVASVSQQQQLQQQQQQALQAHQAHLQQHTLQLHTQPQQHHAPYAQQLVPHPQHAHQMAAAAAAAAGGGSVLPQSNQYTQSTTNLINININSGGVTTIATGENHQPPYSLQSEQQHSLEQQQQQHHHQQLQLQHQQQLAQAQVSNGSICLQTMPKPSGGGSSECSYKNCHLNISASVTTAAATSSSASYTASRRTTPRGSQELLHQLPQQQQLQQQQTQQQQYLTVADVEINASASAASYHSLPASSELLATPTHAQVLQHQQQQQQQQQQHHQQMLAAAMSAPSMEILQPLEISTISAGPACSTADQATQLPLHATLKAQQQQQHQQQQQQQQQQQLSLVSGSSNKTPSSSRRYHRTIPRYFAVADPLQVNVSSKSKSSSSSNSNSSEAASSKASKKPMCQCPIQHVPMSYMGSTANANAFLSGAGKLFSNSSSNSSPTCSLSPGAAVGGGGSVRHAGTLAYGQRAKSSTNLQQHAQDLITAAGVGTLKRSGGAACGHELKIATISKQVGDETQTHHHPHVSGSSGGSSGGVNVSAIIPPPPLQHAEDVSAPPIVLGRVQKRSSSSSNSGELRGRSTNGSGSAAGRSASSSSSGGGGAADVLSSAYLNRKVDAYLSLTQKQQQHFFNQQQQQQQKQQQKKQQQQQNPDQSNPTLPPKLYKSLTNLKSATVTKTSTAPAPTSSSSSSNNNSVATIYTLSKPGGASSSVQRKEQTTPTLTLPPASPNAASTGEKLLLASGKINSSTFYPLANHVTYTLPKHISGKVSLNSTINSVVSKVPSVISIPSVENNNATGGGQGTAATTAVTSKSTTLPKILRVKRDTGTGTGTSTSPAIAHCQMPNYPLAASKSSASGVRSATASASTTPSKQLPVCTTSKNCLNPKEHFLPNDTSLDDDYLSECENCKIAQSAKYYLDAEMSGGGSSASPQETMTLQRKSLEETKEEPHDSYYRSSHTLPSNAKKHGSSSKNNNREPWQFSTIPAASSSDEDVNE
ncbi:AF4/FMR2 family member 4 isoform X1 [Drosophila miranda]|uniref:AF4/FMR2 family member 4 isoform X1 n=1 Tax=Drosophila miranda TaxID=7229 RepID=UPI0007E5FF3B|nr:AF4/FMR2 family member 4 isoform X1 [Drosophila miranda]